MLRSVLNNHPSEISCQSSINLRNLWQREEDHFSWLKERGHAITITDWDAATSGELVIPDTIGGNPVTSIGIQAFKNWVLNTKLKHVPELQLFIPKGLAR